jgi:hypothetical protein
VHLSLYVRGSGGMMVIEMHCQVLLPQKGAKIAETMGIPDIDEDHVIDRFERYLPFPEEMKISLVRGKKLPDVSLGRTGENHTGTGIELFSRDHASQRIKIRIDVTEYEFHGTDPSPGSPAAT